VEIQGCGARKVLADLAAANVRVDLLDLDPFGNCMDLLPLAAKVVDFGVVCLTTGEIYQVYRGLNRRGGKITPKRYRGRKVISWLHKELLPEVLGALPRAELVHFYAYPTSVRMILRIGEYPIYSYWFSRRPKYLSWLA
jgi:hypothetical protein